MDVFEFRTELWLPRPIEEVFGFFSNARNLEAITPGWLRFKILSEGELEVHAGMLIDYALRIHGIPVRWQTEITAWEPPFRFVDEQRRGPYRLWRHEHTFSRRDGGTHCADHVRYAVPGGALFNRWFVRPDIERIFAFRREKLLEVLGTSSARQKVTAVAAGDIPEDLTGTKTPGRSRV